MYSNENFYENKEEFIQRDFIRDVAYIQNEIIAKQPNR